MTNKDTLCLLKECDSGTKMAVSSIDEILDKTEDSRLKQLLSETKNHHEKLGNEIHTLLIQQGSKDQEPTPTPDPTPAPDTGDDNKKSDETISGDKEQAEDSVKTADVYNVAGYSIMLFMALAGIVFVIHEDKKKKNTID